MIIGASVKAVRTTQDCAQAVAPLAGTPLSEPAGVNFHAMIQVLAQCASICPSPVSVQFGGARTVKQGEGGSSKVVPSWGWPTSNASNLGEALSYPISDAALDTQACRIDTAMIEIITGKNTSVQPAQTLLLA